MPQLELYAEHEGLSVETPPVLREVVENELTERQSAKELRKSEYSARQTAKAVMEGASEREGKLREAVSKRDTKIDLLEEQINGLRGLRLSGNVSEVRLPSPHRPHCGHAPSRDSIPCDRRLTHTRSPASRQPSSFPSRHLSLREREGGRERGSLEPRTWSAGASLLFGPLQYPEVR